MTRPPATPGRPDVRQRAMLALVLALLAVLGGRLVQVQGFQGDELARRAYEQRLHTVTIPGDRGQILDAGGVVLASSVERWNVAVNQQQFAEGRTPQDAADRAEELAPLLGVPAAELAGKLWGGEEKRQFVYLAKGLVPEVYEQVVARRVPGVSGERTTERSYPAGTTAGNVLGFVSADGQGQAGVEQVFDVVLAGVAGSETFERGRRGQRIPMGERASVPATPGHDVQLTIDRDLQYVAQTRLDEQVAATGAEWGALQITDVRTGAVLTLADSGSVDPNEPGATPAEERASRAVADAYEPGSTAKVITMAAVLEHGIADPTTPFQIPYTYTTSNGQTFKDSHPHPTLPLTLTGVLAESSNTGTIMVGEQLPEQVRHDWLRKFGFGEKTGMGLPGEQSGMLRPAESWDGRSKYAVLFGQAVSSTTLQNTQVFATLANGGVRLQPHIVAGTRAPDGTFTPVQLPEPQRVVSEEVADAVVRMLESAVAEGTGSNAAIPGYRVAGKTGTAQAFEGSVIKHVSSFIGIVPADDPRLVVNVVLYEPKTSIYGGAVAAPVFRDVTAYALQHLGVPPTGSVPELYPATHE